MALKSTVYHFAIDLSDMDRAVYEAFKVPVALHPSESVEFMLTRVLAYSLEYKEGICFSSAGIGSSDEPAISIKGFDGRCHAWIEIGAPDSERLHKAAKIAQRVAVYCHRSAVLVHAQLLEKRIFRGEEISFYSFADAFIGDLCAALDRRNEMSVSRSDQSIYVTLNGRSFSSAIMEKNLV